MKNDARKTTTVRLLILFLLTGIVILAAVFEIQTNVEKKKANTDAADIIAFMKKQCIRYEDILTNSKVRIQTDLIEKGTELRRCLLEKGTLENEELDQYLDEQRLTGILILDDQLNTEQGRYLEEIERDTWKNSFDEQDIQSLLRYPNNIVTDQIAVDEENHYYYAALPVKEQNKIIICYEKAYTQADMEDELGMGSMLTGYKVERDGTVVCDLQVVI